MPIFVFCHNKTAKNKMCSVKGKISAKECKGMKKSFIAILSAMILLNFTGCDNGNSQTSPDGGTESNNSGESEQSVFADFEGDYPDHPISFLTDEEEIRKRIDAQPNLKCAERLYINIPESASLYEYHTYSVHVPQFEYPSTQFLADFETAFKYLFPDREINPEFLKYRKYWGYDYEKQDTIDEIGYVKDTENLPDQITLTYDEMPERTEVWTSPVYLEIPLEIGLGGEINKGEAAYIAGKIEYDVLTGLNPSDTYNKLSSFYPSEFFKTVGTYTPQSEKSFMLSDGEMKICDAVKFAEDYINNIPISTGLTRNIRTSVYSVEVLQLGEDTYGYYFKTEPSFRGVIYEPAFSGSYSGSRNYDATMLGGALMVRSDDVDLIKGVFGSEWTFDVNVCQEIIPVEEAIKKVSEKLSQSVTFEVISVDLIYVGEYAKDGQGYINIDTYDASRRPAWRITTGNLNDDRTYICFVEAVGDGKFSYFSAPGITYYDD